MSQIHSHYENLKVARSAPPEVIRAAYKALARIHHPDVNPSPDSARIMVLVNVAHDVLSDPQKRADHDKWIIEQERHLSSSALHPYQPSVNPQEEPASDESNTSNDELKFSTVAIYLISAMIFVLIAIEILKPEEQSNKSPQLSGQEKSPTIKNQEAVAANFLTNNPPKPILIPNGQLLFLSAKTPAAGELHINFNAQSEISKPILEGSVIRAVKMAHPIFCGHEGLIVKHKLIFSKIIVGVQDQGIYLGEIMLPSTFCE